MRAFHLDVLALGPATASPEPTVDPVPTAGHLEPESTPADASLDAVLAAHVRRVLAHTRGNKREAARILGISPSRLYRLLARHGITVS